jgi:superfamily I DNA/RNA helicase
MQATQQQLEITRESRSSSDVIVEARAGTGKTTQIEMVCRDQMQNNILLLCFNKDIRVAAEARMPANVTCKTFHQLGWPTYGKYFDSQMKLRFYTKKIAKLIRCEESIINVAKETVRKFTASDDRVITGFHVPYASYVKKGKEEQNAFKEEVVSAARTLWTHKTNFKNREVPVDFDDWLKMFELEGRVRGQFDKVIIDEGQDVTKRDLSIANKINSPRLLVGDSFQQLYEWRGSINSLDEIGIENALYLTQSFRFGCAIAEKANEVLALLNHNCPPLVGYENVDSQISWDNKPTERHTILCRTNAGLLSNALDMIRKGKTIHIVGNMADMVRRLESAWYLSIGDKHRITHPEIQLIGDWESLLELAKLDVDMKMLVQQVMKYNSQIPGICEELKSSGEASESRADVILSTVHKAKGLEWDVVRLAEDFPEEMVYFSHRERKWVVKKAEVYCLYVAVTRAKLKLYVNSTISQLKHWKSLLS